MKMNGEMMIDSIVHHYVNPDGTIDVPKVMQNWRDPIEAIRMLITIFSRYHGVYEESFDELMKIIEKIKLTDIQKNRGGIAGAIVYFAIVKNGRFSMSKRRIATIFGVNRMTIQNNQENVERLIARSRNQ